MARVFLDANVLFSAAHRASSGLSRLWTAPDTVLITSSYALEEARRNLTDDEQRTRLANLAATLEIVSTLQADPPFQCEVELPEKDTPILQAAVQAKAAYLLTGDVRHFGPYFGQTVNGVMILPPADYLRGR